MQGCPPVSCFCPTYGRVHLLEEAIESFLRQDYPGERELVVLNDLDGQMLALDHPLVRIVNVPTKFATLGEKRNRCVELARHDVLFPWDDDDIYLPHRLSYSLSRLDLERGWFRPAVALVLTDGRLSGPQENLFHSQSCYTRELFERVGRYTHARKSDDLAFEQAVARAHGRSTLTGMPVTESDIYYLYRWSAQALYHLSWFSETPADGPQASERTATLVRTALDSGAIPSGRIELQPRWAHDYPREVADYLASRTMTNDDAGSTPTAAIERITIAELERRLREEAEREAERRGAERVQEENTRFFRFAALRSELLPSATDQRRLLEAAALRGAPARDAWQALASRSMPWERLHPKLWALIPPLYANLRRLGLEAESNDFCKKHYLAALSRNRHLVTAAREALDALTAAGIEVVVVGDGAVLPLYHGDWGAHALQGLTLCVPEPSLGHAADVLREQRWTARDRLTRTTRLPAAMRFRSEAGELAVRWHLPPVPCVADGDDALWAATVPLEMDGGETRTLGPTEQLFEVVAQAVLTGIYGDDDGDLWMIDAMAILHAADEGLDWARLSRLARATRLVESTRARLARLRDELGAPIPWSVLEELGRWLPTLPERIERATVARRDPRERRLLNVTSQFLRLRHHPRYRPWVWGPLRFLQDLWDLDRASAVPRAMVRRAGYHLRGLMTPP